MHNLPCVFFNINEIEQFIENQNCIISKSSFNLRGFKNVAVDKNPGNSSVLGII